MGVRAVATMTASRISGLLRGSAGPFGSVSALRHYRGSGMAPQRATRPWANAVDHAPSGRVFEKAACLIAFRAKVLQKARDLISGGRACRCSICPGRVASSPARRGASGGPSPSGWPSTGARVVVSSRKEEACRAVADAINARHGEGRADVIAASISSKPRPGAAGPHHRGTPRPHRRPVCNAASNPYYGPMSGIADEQFRKILDNNVVASNWLVSFAAPAWSPGATARSSWSRRSAG